MKQKRISIHFNAIGLSFYVDDYNKVGITGYAYNFVLLFVRIQIFYYKTK